MLLSFLAGRVNLRWVDVVIMIVRLKRVKVDVAFLCKEGLIRTSNVLSCRTLSDRTVDCWRSAPRERDLYSFGFCQAVSRCE